MQTSFLNELGVKTPGELRRERAVKRREEETLRKSRNAHQRAMAAKARASQTATCCLYHYDRRIGTSGWQRCVKCHRPLIYS